jgi:hypothetical protein
MPFGQKCLSDKKCLSDNECLSNKNVFRTKNAVRTKMSFGQKMPFGQKLGTFSAFQFARKPHGTSFALNRLRTWSRLVA